MAKQKRQMSAQQEFEIMKLVLDKFLWFGFGIMAYGLFTAITSSITQGIVFFIVGIIVLLVFLIMIVKEYEFIEYGKKR